MSSVGFRASKIWIFFGKLTAEQVLKSFSGRSNSLKPTVSGFSNSLLFGLGKSRVEKPCLVGFWGNRHSKTQKISAKSFFVFEPPL